MTQDNNRPINIAQFQELKDLLEEDFTDLIQTYMNDSETRLSEIAKALQSKDYRLGFEAAHSLKGASSNLGATHLSELCYQLQEVCRDNQLEHNQALVEEVSAEARAVNERIKQLIG